CGRMDRSLRSAFKPAQPTARFSYSAWMFRATRGTLVKARRVCLNDNLMNIRNFSFINEVVNTSWRRHTDRGIQERKDHEKKGFDAPGQRAPAGHFCTHHECFRSAEDRKHNGRHG